MSEKINELIPIFQELKSASMSAGNDPEKLRKYNLVFYGAKCNTINTLDLHHVLINHFHISIEMDEFQKLVPDICSFLSMKYHPLQNVADLTNPVPLSYRVELW